MPISDDTLAWRRRLPHLQKPEKTYFVTYCTIARRRLDDREREIAYDCCIYTHRRTAFVHAVCVMPDHVHLLATIFDCVSLDRYIQTIKSVSAHCIGRMIWQRGYFDRIMRDDEDLREKAEYTAANPVRAGIVTDVDDYDWIWRWWIEGEMDSARPHGRALARRGRRALHGDS